MKKEKIGHDTDKAMAKVGSAPPKKSKKLQTESPISEKDEEKKAEDELRERMRRKRDL